MNNDDLKKEIDKLEQSISHNSPIRVVRTDTVIMEFVPLPIIDLSFRFLFRFLEPVATVWQEARISYFERTIEKTSEETIKEINQPLHEKGIKTFRLKRFALEQWEMLVLNGNPKDELPEVAKWLVEIEKANVYECEIIRKNTKE